MKKGKFIVFEGPDRSGKTTQINLLAKWLRKKKIKFILTREPGGTKLSERLRALLLNPKNKMCPLTELFLYEASRAQHVKELILPSLESGKIVISDRFTLASCAYQGYGRKIPVKTVKMLNKIATENLKPDITFVLNIPDKFFVRRRDTSGADRIESESSKFRKEVNKAYKILGERENLTVINAGDTINNIHRKIIKVISTRIGIV